MNETKHRAFSFARVFALTSNTFTDLTRQKVFYFILIFSLILIGSSVFMASFSFQQEFQILKDISLGTMSILTSLLAIPATARLLPQDIEDRTAYGLVIMSALFFAVLYAREQTVLHETARQMSALPRDQLEEALRVVRASALHVDLVGVIAILFLKAAVLAALTLLITTFATTNIFIIIVMVFVYFIGHLQSTAREYWLQQQGGGWLTHLFLAVVALIFPDLQSFNLVDLVVAGSAIPLALILKTAAMGFFYVIVYTLLATVMFYGKEL